MSAELHRSLVALKVFSSEGSQLMKAIVKDLGEKCEVLISSSVYKIAGESENPRHIHELRGFEAYDGLAAVLVVTSTEGPRELLSFLKEIEVKYRSEMLRRSASIKLLVFDDFTCMTPDLTLPHPELHVQPEALILAAEVWGEYVHPVLGQSLYSLTRRFNDKQWGRFQAQGKTLLDF